MAVQSVATRPNTNTEIARGLFDEHPEDVIAMVKVGSDRLYDLAGLFEAIGAAAEAGSVAVSQIKRLASIGSYLAEDTANLLDERQEHYTHALTASKEA